MGGSGPTPTKRNDHRGEGLEKATQLATQKTLATTKMDDHKEKPGKAAQKAAQKGPIKMGDPQEGPRRTTQLAAHKTLAPAKMDDRNTVGTDASFDLDQTFLFEGP